MVDQYVVPVPEGWGVRESTSREIAQVFATKEEAIAFATGQAELQNSAIFVQHVDGETEKLDSFRPASQATEIDSIRIGDEYQSRQDET